MEERKDREPLPELWSTPWVDQMMALCDSRATLPNKLRMEMGLANDGY